jgi:hypothetical protein
MSILDHNSEAKDGFYWITLNTKKPNKVLLDFSKLSSIPDYVLGK